jgi:hypothetical protein
MTFQTSRREQLRRANVIEALYDNFVSPKSHAQIEEAMYDNFVIKTQHGKNHKTKGNKSK